MAQAAATTLTFDSISNKKSDVPNGYGGLNWDNVGVLAPSGSNGFANDLHSGNQVAFNEFSTDATISAKHDFAIKSGYFAAGNEDDVTVTFTGYNDGVQVAQMSVVLDEQQTKIKFDPGFSHITQLVISSTNETNPSLAHVAMDDLKVRIHAARSAASTEAVQEHAHHHHDNHVDPAALSGHDAGALVV